MKNSISGRKNRKIVIIASAALLIIVLAALLLTLLRCPSTPAKPLGVTVTPRSCAVVLKWKPNTELNLQGYKVYINGNFKRQYGKSVNSAVLTELLPGVRYTFSVEAVNSKNPSPQVTVAATPLAMKLTQVNTVTTPSGNFPEYSKFLAASTAGAVVPGQKEDMVPQGLGYIASKNWYIISYYSHDETGSMLSIVDASTGTLVKSMGINDVDKSPYKGHAGGVTVSASNVRISSDAYLRRIPLQAVIDAADGSQVQVADRFNTGVNASFTMYAGGVLWAGEFYQVTSYPTSPSHFLTARDGTSYHSWMTGFKLDSATDTLAKGRSVNDNTVVTPDYILSIPDLVQGALTLSDGSILLSESYGRTTDSQIQCFENVLSQPQHTKITVNGTSVPVWFLDGKSLKSEVTALPMAEGMIEKDGLISVLFESCAATYSPTCKYPTGTLWNVKPSLF